MSEAGLLSYPFFFTLLSRLAQVRAVHALPSCLKNWPAGDRVHQTQRDEGGYTKMLFSYSRFLTVI